MNLYLVHVGFYDDEIGMYELHTNILVVAENIQDAKQKVKNKEIFIKKNMHIDAIQEILLVDNYKITLIKQTKNIENKIFNYDDIKNLI